jgi:transposase InsO family protein
VTERTLRNWVKEEKEGDDRILGRPRYGEHMRFMALIKVARVLNECGRGMSWRAVKEKLGDLLPTRLLQESVKTLKKYYRARRYRRLKKFRVRTAIHRKDVVWCQDATHLGREEGTAIEAQVIRDGKSFHVKGLQVGQSASTEQVIDYLKSFDELPLVWQTDNGSAYISEGVQSFLEQRKVVHLVSRPGTPTDNPVAERGMREIKEHTGLGKCFVIKGIEKVVKHLVERVACLNSNLKRPSQNFKTSAEAEASTLSWHGKVRREEFYNSVKKKLDKVFEKTDTLEERRVKERHVIYKQLVQCGLATVTKGGVSCYV